MTRDCRTHLWNRLSELCESLKLAQLAHAVVAFVVQVLPTPCGIFSNHLQLSVRRGVDEDVSPCRRNLQVVDPFQIFVCNAPALRFVAEAAFRSAEPADAGVLQTVEVSHRNEICLYLSVNGRMVSQEG